MLDQSPVGGLDHSIRSSEVAKQAPRWSSRRWVPSRRCMRRQKRAHAGVRIVGSTMRGGPMGFRPWKVMGGHNTAVGRSPRMGGHGSGVVDEPGVVGGGRMWEPHRRASSETAKDGIRLSTAIRTVGAPSVGSGSTGSRDAEDRAGSKCVRVCPPMTWARFIRVGGSVFGPAALRTAMRAPAVMMDTEPEQVDLGEDDGLHHDEVPTDGQVLPDDGLEGGFRRPEAVMRTLMPRCQRTMSGMSRLSRTM